MTALQMVVEGWQVAGRCIFVMPSIRITKGVCQHSPYASGSSVSVHPLDR